MTVWRDSLFICGGFTTVDGEPVRQVAQWIGGGQKLVLLKHLSRRPAGQCGARGAPGSLKKNKNLERTTPVNTEYTK